MSISPCRRGSTAGEEEDLQVEEADLEVEEEDGDGGGGFSNGSNPVANLGCNFRYAHFSLVLSSFSSFLLSLNIHG